MAICELPPPIVLRFPVDQSLDLAQMVPQGARPIVELVAFRAPVGVPFDYFFGWETEEGRTAQANNGSTATPADIVEIFAGATAGGAAGPPAIPNAFVAAGLDAQPLRAPRDNDRDWMRLRVRATPRAPSDGAVNVWVRWEWDPEGLKVRNPGV